MKKTIPFILLLAILSISSCKKSASKPDIIQEHKQEQQTEKDSKSIQRTYTEEEINKKRDSLIGKMARMDIQPYLDSLQGKEYVWEYPENWKFKEKDALDMLQSWNVAHNNHDAVEIVDHYFGDYYILYGKENERSDAIELKQKLFRMYPDFSQKIIPNSIKYSGNENFIDRVDFQKSVTMNGKKQVYNSYLVFGTTQGATGIIEEGDVE
ncbi:hypothetical protein JCM19294_2295 [Nonlabens tegetincola]|uniref:Lipoprotein n=1 Tax=Nonlabens tegetincola TaxID=323273 RepID=A0A090Q1E0_9FLAO|nr:hypothetical protein [Nonlabens tegetincola]GAK95513.1 hypothetical protein JCM19294_2295 [Nonlabens tegetincola]